MFIVCLKMVKVERCHMSRKIWILLLLGCLLLLSGACSSNTASEATAADVAEAEDAQEDEETESVVEETATDTPEPTQTTAPTPTARAVLWEDDFSDVNSGWERYREYDGVLDYDEDEEIYQMQILADDSLWWVYMNESLPDVGMSVDVWLVDGPEGSLYGLLCRYDYNVEGKGYVFMISAEGQAGVGVIGEDYSFDPIPGGELTSFDVIETGLNAVNTIDAVCVGDQLMMYVNGELLFDLAATGLTGEYIGLTVATPMGAGADVYFDNLVVYTP